MSFLHDIWNPWHGCVKCSEGCQNCYGAQKGDGAPVISAEEQQRQTADELAAWMNLQ